MISTGFGGGGGGAGVPGGAPVRNTGGVVGCTTRVSCAPEHRRENTALLNQRNSAGGLAGSPSCRGRPKTWIGKPDVRPTEKNHPAKSCPEGTFFDSPGFVRSTTLGHKSKAHFSPEGAGLIGARREYSRGEFHLSCTGPPVDHTIGPNDRLAATPGYGGIPLQKMTLADVGLCSSRDVLRSIADGVLIQVLWPPIGTDFGRDTQWSGHGGPPGLVFDPCRCLRTPIKPAPSGLIVCTGPQPRVVLRTNPGLSKNVPSGHGVARWCSHWDTSGGFRSGCLRGPSGRVFSDVGPMERTRRSAPPRPRCWALAGGVLGGAHMGGWPIQVLWLPIGTRVFGWMSNGADTEVRPPAIRVLGPCGGGARWRAHWGWPIQAFGLPIGTGVFGCWSNGADTEVRPPATPVLGPCGGCARWRAHGRV
jgi:hypothetical protein